MRSQWARAAIVLGMALSAQIAAAGEDIVASAKWDTPGADIDLAIVGPNNQIFRAQQDFRSGPATEIVSIPNPAPGQYKVCVVWQDDKPNLQVPVTVEVRQGGRQVGTFPVILSAGNPNDRKIVATLNVGAGPASRPGPVAPAPPRDPLGFAAQWIEYWPGVNVHDLSEITFDHGQYQVKVRNPQTGPYRVDNVRVEGNVLEFTEYTGNHTINYEARLQDANTCVVTVQGGPAVGGSILWRRDTAGPAAGAGGSLVATLKWETQGTDVDLAVLGPNNQSFTHDQDFTSGPATETCTIRNPVPGDYEIIAVYPDSKGGVQTPVAAEVRLGDKVLKTGTAVLTHNGEVRRVMTVTVGAGGGTGPTVGPGENDRIGFVGTWIEDWPGVRDHDVSLITFQNGQYIVQVTNPRSGPYRVDNIRLDGKALRFTEYIGPNPIQYAVTLQDRTTCAAQVQGGPIPRGPIVWRRQAAAAPGF